MHYTCIACITIDSVMDFNEKIIRKFIQKSVNIGPKNAMSRFINTELKSDSESSDSDLESEKVGSKYNAELMAKSGSDSE